MSDSLFIKRLKKIIGSGSTRKFAVEAGINDGTLRNVLNGTKPSIEIAAAICDHADVSLDWLVSGKESSNHNVKIPRHSLKLSAGGGAPIDRVELIDYIPFTSEFFKKKLPYTNIKDLLIFDAAGDSMVPTINDGDLVMVDSSKNEITDGLFALTIDNMAHIKRLQQTLDGTIIKSDNHELYDNYELKLEDQNRIRIIGKVVWKGSLL